MIPSRRFWVPTLGVVILATGMSTWVIAQEDKKDEPAPAPTNPTPTPTPTPTPAPTAAAALAVPSAPMVNDVKIFFDDKAKNAGELTFTFIPQGGTAKLVRVTIAKKMKGDDVARDAAKELEVALGAGYKVDRYDPDKVKVEGKDNALFSLTISSLTATGLSVRLK